MEEQQLDPLINAADLAGDVHQMHMQQQQQQQPQNNGLPELPQPATAPPLHRHHHHHHAQQQAAPPPQMVVHNVVHTTMYPPPALGGQPLQSHPTLPQLQQQQQQQIATTAPPRKKSDHTNYNHQQSSANTITLNHPQNETYKLKTNQYLLETSSRLDDAVSELYHYTSLLSSNHKKSSSTVECITNMEQSIIPLLKICSNAMKDAGKYFAPFSGTVNIHNRNDAEKKRRLVLEEENKVLLLQNEDSGGDNKRRGRKKRPALLMIDEFVERSKLLVSKNTVVDQDNNSTMAATAATNDNHDQRQQQQEQVGGSLLLQQPPSRKRKATTKKSTTTTTESIIILQPKNGTVYTKSEAIAICKRYRKGSRERGLAIRAMIHKKFVLASRKTLYRLLQQDEEGRVLLENGWLGCGRPMKVDLSLDIGGGGGGVVPKGQMLVNSSLTFEELDRGEENRILVELKKGGGGGGGLNKRILQTFSCLIGLGGRILDGKTYSNMTIN